MSDDGPLGRPLRDGPDDRTGGDATPRDQSARDRLPAGHRTSPWRVIVVSFVVVVMAVVAYYAVTVAQVVHTGGSHGADGGDSIMVMGAAQYDGRPSPQLAARLDHAYALWSGGVAPVIVVTGGNIPGDRFTEAEASVRYLVERGVPESAIIEVGEGSTTYESAAAAAPVMEAAGIDQVVLVTDPYHALRSRLIVEGEGFSVDVASTPNSVVTGWSNVERSLKEAAGVALGRIIGFERLSDLTG